MDIGEFVKNYMSKDWGQVLLTIVVLIVVLAFIGAPRAISEMIGLVSKSFSSDGYGNDSAPFFVLAGVPAGLFAKNWKVAGLLMLAGFLVTLFGDLRFEEDPEELGQTVIGLALFVALVASTVRVVFLNVRSEAAEEADKQSIKDFFTSKLAVTFFGIIGLVLVAQFGFKEVASDNDYYSESAMEGFEATAEEAADFAMDAAESEADVLGIAAVEAISAAEEAMDELSIDFQSNNFDYSRQISGPNEAKRPTQNETLKMDNMAEVLNRGTSEGREVSSTDKNNGVGLPFTPSFDCALNMGRVEQMICGDPVLAKQDLRLDRSFKAKLAGIAGTEREKILSKQRQALAKRNACQSNLCVVNWYKSELSNY